MGSTFSTLERGIIAVISAIAGALQAIVAAITTAIVTIFNVIGDILRCRGFGSRGLGRGINTRTGRF